MNDGEGSDPDDGDVNGAEVTIGPEPACGNDPDVTGGGAAGNGADVAIGPDPVWGSDPDVTGGGVAGPGGETSGACCDIGPAGGGEDIKVCCSVQDSEGATVASPNDCEIGPDGGGGKGAEVSREGGGGKGAEVSREGGGGPWGDRLPVSRPRTSLVRSLLPGPVPMVVLNGSN